MARRPIAIERIQHRRGCHVDDVDEFGGRDYRRRIVLPILGEGGP
jgi:hypothetical protein